MIEPHGGKLVNRLVTGPRAAELEAESARLPAFRLDAFELSDLEMLSIGGFSPLEGFMTRADYDAVVHTMHLSNGLAWTLPVTLAVSSEEASELREGSRVALADAEGRRLGVLAIEDIFRADRQEEARQVFRTTEEAHPGVKYLYSRGEDYLGGRVELFRRPGHAFSHHRLDPAETRGIFEERGWLNVVGFMYRSQVHHVPSHNTRRK